MIESKGAHARIQYWRSARTYDCTWGILQRGCHLCDFGYAMKSNEAANQCTFPSATIPLPADTAIQGAFFSYQTISSSRRCRRMNRFSRLCSITGNRRSSLPKLKLSSHFSFTTDPVSEAKIPSYLDTFCGYGKSILYHFSTLGSTCRPEPSLPEVNQSEEPTAHSPTGSERSDRASAFD